MTENKKYTICVLGIYPIRFPRDIVYLRGLEMRGVKLVECIDSTPSWKKYLGLVRKLYRQGRGSDAVFVTYLSVAAAVIARVFSNKPVIYNAANSMYESVVIEREECGKYSPGGLRYWLMDFLAFHCAHRTLVESNAQKYYICKTFFVSEQKVVRVWTSADERVFFPDSSVRKNEVFTVLFRGQLAPFVGVEYILQAAKLLRLRKDIRFVIRGWGMLTAKVERMVVDEGLKNVELIKDFLTPEKMRELMLSSHVSLGQFGDHVRAGRTIANKSFETIAMGLPFITADLAANREIFTDKQDVLLVPPADSYAIAHAIVSLKDNAELREKISKGGRELFLREASSEAVGRQLFELFWSLIQVS